MWSQRAPPRLGGHRHEMLLDHAGSKHLLTTAVAEERVLSASITPSLALPSLLEYSASLAPISYSLHPSGSILTTPPLPALRCIPVAQGRPRPRLLPAHTCSSCLLVSGLILVG